MPRTVVGAMRLVGYLRVSTDDKGQDPDRQRAVIQKWADSNNHTVLVWVKDEGTSGATDPFQRQAVLEAIEEAQELKADGIVVEAVDRWTREGMEALAVSKFRLRVDKNGLQLFIANAPTGLPPAFMELIDGMLAAVAKMWLDRHKAAVKSGIALAKAKGFPNGQPGRRPKPQLTAKEQEILTRLIDEGLGVDRLALELSRIRGAYEVADPKARAKLEVKPTWLWKSIRSQMPWVRERLSARGSNAPVAIEVESEQPGATQ